LVFVQFEACVSRCVDLKTKQQAKTKEKLHLTQTSNLSGKNASHQRADASTTWLRLPDPRDQIEALAARKKPNFCSENRHSPSGKKRAPHMTAAA